MITGSYRGSFKVKRVMQMYDSNGYLKNPYGVAGMCVTDVPVSQRNQIISVSERAREDMYEACLRHFKLENGVANGDTTNRTAVYTK